jgi:Glucodextranase, domain B
MRCRIALAVAVVGALIAAAPVQAANVTESTVQVTSPLGTYLLADELIPTEITGVGTSNGNATSHVDIKCFSGKSSSLLVEKVPVAANGTFSFSAPLGEISDEACVLRAVDSADVTDYPPGSPSTLQGPTLAISQREDNTVPTGPNKGKLRSFYIYAAQLRGAFDYDSLGNCTIDDGYVFDTTTFESRTIDYCNAWFYYRNGFEGGGGFASPTRSELRVDGSDSYLAGHINQIGAFAQENPGYPTLSYSFSIDPATGNLVLEEIDQVVTCSPTPATYPPTSGSCSSFVPTGVQVVVRMSQDQGGRVASVVQRFESTDGRSHAIDLLDDNEFRHEKEDGQLNFPWTGLGAAPYTIPGQEIPGPSGGPGSFFVKGSAAVADGGEEAAQGAVTFSNPPLGATIIGTTNNASKYSWVDLHYQRTVPAGGSTSLGFTYSNAFLLSELGADAAAAQASYLPSVAIGAPANGSGTSQATAVVSGTANDANGLASLSVNGHAVAVAANGTWSTSLPLSVGANAITATATNIFGNSAQTQTSVTYAPIVTALSIKGKPAGSSKGVTFTVSCHAAPGQSCDGLALLSSTEHLRGRHVSGLSARARTRRVTVGRATFVVPAGQSRKVLVKLNRTGHALLTRFHSLPLTMSVTLTNGTGGKPHAVVRSRLVIRVHRKHQ